MVDGAELAVDELAPVAECLVDRGTVRYPEEEIDIGPPVLGVTGGGAGDGGTDDPLVVVRTMEQLRAHLPASLDGEDASTLLAKLVRQRRPVGVAATHVCKLEFAMC
jgi:hypothetical protein